MPDAKMSSNMAQNMSTNTSASSLLSLMLIYPCHSTQRVQFAVTPKQKSRCLTLHEQSHQETHHSRLLPEALL